MARSRSVDTPAPGLAQPYAGERAVLAAVHGKQAAIIPTLRDALGLIVDMAPDLDTDALGTFTGEIPRIGSIRETAIATARLGMAATGLPIGIASEGSYGPHPLIRFVAGGIESMVLVDDVRGIVVTEHLIEDAPVYGHAVAACRYELDGFLARHRFPGHALIVKPDVPTSESAPIHKGLSDTKALADAITEVATASADGKAFVQTDMRAHMNPVRMDTIARLAGKLCARVAVPCPVCETLGYGQVDVEQACPASAAARSPTWLFTRSTAVSRARIASPDLASTAAAKPIPAIARSAIHDRCARLRRIQRAVSSTPTTAQLIHPRRSKRWSRKTTGKLRWTSGSSGSSRIPT
ncbi:MAG: DUF6671 family protein [Rhodanobacter sp.]